MQDPSVFFGFRTSLPPLTQTLRHFTVTIGAEAHTLLVAECILRPASSSPLAKVRGVGVRSSPMYDSVMKTVF